MVDTRLDGMNTEDTAIFIERTNGYLDIGNLKMTRQTFQRITELHPGHAKT